MGNRQIDLHVGLRLRQRRMALGITQAELAKAVGLTFQQIQKYESGANQLVSSRLYELAAALGVPVSFFFDGLARSERSSVANLAGLSLLATAEAQRLILSYWKIDKTSVRKHVRDLIHPCPLSQSSGHLSLPGNCGERGIALCCGVRRPRRISTCVAMIGLPGALHRGKAMRAPASLRSAGMPESSDDRAAVRR